MAIERIGLACDGVEIIGEALLARRQYDALRIRLIAIDRAEFGGEIFSAADAGARHPGVQEVGPIAHRHRNLGLKGDRLLKPALADETPWADDIGYDVDRQCGFRDGGTCGGGHWVLLDFQGEDRVSGEKGKHPSRLRLSGFASDRRDMLRSENLMHFTPSGVR